MIFLIVELSIFRRESIFIVVARCMKVNSLGYFQIIRLVLFHAMTNVLRVAYGCGKEMTPLM